MERTDTNGAATLQQHLNEPDTMATLQRLLDRITTLEETMATVTNTVQ